MINVPIPDDISNARPITKNSMTYEKRMLY